jgi:hypothetical protein
MNSWTELRWWLLAATVFTTFAVVCAYALRRSSNGWAGLTGLAATCVLPPVAEAFIQFKDWWRRLLWIFAGILSFALIVYFYSLRPATSSPFAQELPEWIRGPITFLLPAILEFVAASGARKHAWIWVATTPALLGLITYWVPPVVDIANDAFTLLLTHGVVLTSGLPHLYVVATIFGTVLSTRALIGSLIASRNLTRF